jgi:hypothetical protein
MLSFGLDTDISMFVFSLERSRRIQSADRDSGFVTSPKYSPDPLGSFIGRSPRSPTSRPYSPVK